MKLRVSKKISTRDIVLLILIVLIAPLLTSSYLAPSLNGTVLYFLYIHKPEAIITLTVLMLIRYKNGYGKLSISQKNTIVLYLIYVIIGIFYIFIGKSSIHYSSLRELFMWFLTNIFCVYLFAITDVKDRAVLLKLYLLISTFLVLDFCIVKTIKIDSSLLSASLAGAPFTSMLMLYIGACLIWFLHDKNVFTRVILLISIISSFYAIAFILERASNTLLVIGLIAIIIFCNNKKGKNEIIIFVIAIITLVILLYSGVITRLLISLANMTGSERLINRINSIIEYASYGNWDAGGQSAVDRINLIGRSFNTWTSSIKNFLIGAGDHRKNNYIIGNHGVLIDTCARYGLIGFSLLFAGFTRQMQGCCKRISDNSIKRQVVCIFVIYILRGIIGNILEAGMVLQLFFYLPMIIEHCENKNK